MTDADDFVNKRCEKSNREEDKYNGRKFGATEEVWSTVDKNEDHKKIITPREN